MDDELPGEKAQADLRAKARERILRDQSTIIEAVSKPFGREVWEKLEMLMHWTDEDRVVWLNAPHPELESLTPTEIILSNPHGDTRLYRVLLHLRLGIPARTS